MYTIEIWYFDKNKKKTVRTILLPFIPVVGQYISFIGDGEDYYVTKKITEITINTNECGCFENIELDFTK